MWLDLKSLKKIWPSGAEPEATTSVASDEGTVATADPITSNTISAPASSSPRLSLSALKKEAGSSTEAVLPLVEVNQESTEESSWKPGTIVEAPVTVESIVQEEPLAISIETDDDPKEVLLGLDAIAQEVSQDTKTPDSSEETLSLNIETKEVVTQEPSTEPQKIFFPEFDVTKEFGLEDDLFGGVEPGIIATLQTQDNEKESTLTIIEEMPEIIAASEAPEIQETITDTSAQETPIETSMVETLPAISPVEAVTPEESAPVDTQSIQEVLATVSIDETNTNESITPEYVESVKKSLSEPEMRKGGISRLAKTLVAASLMWVLFVGGMMGWSALSKHGKANITEWTTNPPVVSTTPINTPVETPKTPVLTSTSEATMVEVATPTGDTDTDTLTESGATNTGSTSTGTLTTSGTTNTGSTSTGVITSTSSTSPVSIENPVPVVENPQITSQTITSTSGVQYQVVENTKKNIRRPKNTHPQQ